MFKRRRHLFTQRKTSYKILLSISLFFLILLGGYFFTHAYLNNEINAFLINQQKKLKEQNLSITFQLSSPSQWKLWPQVTLDYPTIQKDIPTKPQTIWQTKQTTLSYSLWHPLSLTIKLNGEQLFCPSDRSENCFQTHGSPWNIYLPLIGGYEKNTISLETKEIFYTQSSQSIWDLHSLKLKNIKANLHWNYKAQINESLAFSEIHIEQALVSYPTVPTQTLHNIQLQAAFIKNNNTGNYLYKLLLQKVDFSWNDLSVNTSGKLYFPYPQLIPTGEISLHLDGIDQALYQQLASLNCCAKLKEELSQTSLPSQLNLTLFIRKGIVYLGAIPLQTIWYDHLKALISTYTK